MESSSNAYCPACGHRSAIWQSDFDAEDCGYTDRGIVRFLTCSECGAEIEVFIPDLTEGETEKTT